MTSISSWIFLCDFDGTISRTGLSDFLYGKFASCGMKYSDLWAQDRIGTKEEIEKSFQHISASKEEMEIALSGVPLVKGFVEFYEFTRQQGLDLIVVSDGLEWAIRFVLAQAGIENIKVMSNRIYFEPEGFRFEFPYFDPSHPKIGVCKVNIVKKFKQAEKKVILIGDGKTDIDATHAVDFVFARDALWDYCQSQGIPSHPYRDFFDILDFIRQTDLIN